MTTTQRIEQLVQKYENDHKSKIYSYHESTRKELEKDVEAFESELHALLLSLQDEQKEKLKNPTIIKQILESNMQERKIVDDLGFTGEYRLSEKQVLDVIIDLIEKTDAYNPHKEKV